MSKAANQDLMDGIHRKVATAIDKRLDGQDISGEDGEIIHSPPSDADLALAIKFLKDNSIFSAPEQNDATKKLAEKLAARGRVITDADREAALRAIGQNIMSG